MVSKMISVVVRSKMFSVMNLVLKNSLLIQNTILAFTENRIRYNIQVSIMTSYERY